MEYRASREIVLGALADGKPMGVMEIAKKTKLNRSQAGNALMLAWRRGLVLRTVEPIYEAERINRGRAGVRHHVRPFHLYLSRPARRDEVTLGGRRFVPFSVEYLDPRGGGSVSKASRVLELLRSNPGKAFYSTEIAEKLAEHGVKVRDVMANVRRWERRGLVYVRGYKTEERETPFKEGYLITWLEDGKPREEAIAEAVGRTEGALAGVQAGSPLMERVMRVRDIVVEHSQLRKLVGFTYLHEKLGCTPDQSERAVTRALQLYPSLRGVKLFDAYRYYHHESLGGEELDAALEMKRSYLRIAKGRANRVGHNWEASAEWFIDRFTSGARFWTQSHREGGMDSRRINVFLPRGVGGRRRAARLSSSSTFSSSSTIRYFGRSLKRSSKRPAFDRLLPRTNLLPGSLASSSSISVFADAGLPWSRHGTGLSEAMLLKIMSFLSSWPMTMSKRSGGISAVSSCGEIIPW